MDDIALASVKVRHELRGVVAPLLDNLEALLCPRGQHVPRHCEPLRCEREVMVHVVQLLRIFKVNLDEGSVLAPEVLFHPSLGPALDVLDPLKLGEGHQL